MTKSLITLALLGSLTLTLADASVDAQITAIQNAPAQERVALMNQFKQELATMNAEERSAAISIMQTKMQARQGEHQAQGDMTRMRMQEHAGEMQMEQNGQMSQMQNMNQHQAGGQLMHQSGVPAQQVHSAHQAAHSTHSAGAQASAGTQASASGGSQMSVPFSH